MKPGAVLAEKYQLISLIGQGGMGSVWKAEHLAWRSPVAVKVMDPALGTSSDALARFRAEARLAASMRSPHVVQILDDGQDALSGAPFIVMELLGGETLAQRLANSRRLTPPDTARVVTHVARALHLAHEAQMVHRDLKPANIFLVVNDDEELVKVLDFGIAKWNAESQQQNAPTATGTVMGTPYYMSPEQISDSKRVDHRSDLWSLATIAYECLTGYRAFQADSLLALALEICNGRPPPASSLARVPLGFDAWFERATAIDPAARFPSARELARELRLICAAPPPAAGPAPHVTTAGDGSNAGIRTVISLPSDTRAESVAPLTRTRAPRPAPRSERRLVLAVAAPVVALALLGFYLLWPPSEPPLSDARPATGAEGAGAPLPMRSAGPPAKAPAAPPWTPRSPAVEEASPEHGPVVTLVPPASSPVLAPEPAAALGEPAAPAPRARVGSTTAKPGAARPKPAKSRRRLTLDYRPSP